MITTPKPMTVDYAVTLTLNPRCYEYSTLKQSKLARQWFKDCMKPSYRVSAFLEETKDYNIHIHAIISMPMTDTIRKHGARKYLYELFRADFGRQKDIYPVNNYEQWTSYIIKDVSGTKQYNPIIRDDYKLIGDIETIDLGTYQDMFPMIDPESPSEFEA